MLSIVIEGEQRKGVLILYPGQTVRGAVRYTPEKAEKILGVYCKFVSYEHSEWRSKKVVKDDPYVQQGHQEGLEKGGKRKYYAKDIRTLWGHQWGISEKNAKATKFEKKANEWQFEFTIPDGPPSLSFKGGKIRITYMLKAIVRGPARLFGGREFLSVKRPLLVGATWSPARPDFAPFHTTAMFGAVSADIDFLRNCTWPGDTFIFNMTIRTEKQHSAQRSFTIKVLQKWKAGSYDKRDRCLTKFRVSYHVKPEVQKVFFGLAKKRNALVARAVKVPMPGRDVLLPSAHGTLVKLSYSLIVEHEGGAAAMPLTVLSVDPGDVAAVVSDLDVAEAEVIQDAIPAPAVVFDPYGAPLPTYGESMQPPHGQLSPYATPPQRTQSYPTPHPQSPHALSPGPPPPLPPRQPQPQAHPHGAPYPGPNYSNYPPGYESAVLHTAHAPPNQSTSISPPPIPSVPPSSVKPPSNFVRAGFDFTKANPWELNLREGEVVEVLEEDGEWLKGRNAQTGEEGFFPQSYAVKL